MLSDFGNIATIVACVVGVFLWLEIKPPAFLKGAASTGKIRMKPTPRTPRNKTILVLMVLTWIWCGTETYKRIHKEDLRNAELGKPIDKLQAVEGKTFRGEAVDVDGKKFDHCTFQNVKLRYHGKSAAAFVQCTFSPEPGTLYLESDDPAIQNYQAIENMLKALPNTGEWNTYSSDSNGNATKIGIESRKEAPPCLPQKITTQ